jgi:hypothetical protein
VSTTGWIFLVGMRVFDLGGMVIWLVWFFRQKDEPDDDWWDEGGGGGGDPPSSPSDGPRGPGLDLPLPDAGPWPDRLRDHTSAPRRTVERRADPARREPLREQDPARTSP